MEIGFWNALNKGSKNTWYLLRIIDLLFIFVGINAYTIDKDDWLLWNQ